MPTRRSVRKIMSDLSASERILFRKVVDDAVAEALERDLELTVEDVTLRLLCAYERGIRDENELKDAVVYNNPKVYLH